jgi:hypothetical protein
MIEILLNVASSMITNPPLPSPDPLGYPVPPWILQALSYLTLTIHLLAMNFVVGGAILCLWAYIRKQPGHDGAIYFFGSGFPLGVSYIITMGIPPLLFVQVLYGQLFYSSSILMGAFWIQVVPLVIIAYSLFYYHKYNRANRPRGQWAIISLALIAIIYVGFILVNNLTLSMTPDRWLGIYANHPGGGILTHGEKSIHPRLTLFLSGAFAVAGLALIWRGAYLIKWGHTEIGKRNQQFGFRAMLFSPLFWAVSAIGLFFTRGSDLQAMFDFSGGTVILLIIGLLSVIISYLFAFLSIGKTKIFYLILSTLGIFGSMAAMVIFRDLVRIYQLQPYFELSSVPVNAQWGMFTLFMITLAIGAAFLIIYAFKVLPNMAATARERLENK